MAICASSCSAGRMGLESLREFKTKFIQFSTFARVMFKLHKLNVINVQKNVCPLKVTVCQHQCPLLYCMSHHSLQQQ